MKLLFDTEGPLTQQDADAHSSQIRLESYCSLLIEAVCAADSHYAHDYAWGAIATHRAIAWSGA